jgi:predicted transcriptional regulator
MQAPTVATVILKEKFRQYKRESNFSLRMFSDLLELDAGTTSRILSGKRELSLKNISKIFKNIQLTDKERNLLLQSVLMANNIFLTVGSSLDSAS